MIFSTKLTHLSLLLLLCVSILSSGNAGNVGRAPRYCPNQCFASRWRAKRSCRYRSYPLPGCDLRRCRLSRGRRGYMCAPTHYTPPKCSNTCYRFRYHARRDCYYRRRLIHGCRLKRCRGIGYIGFSCTSVVPPSPSPTPSASPSKISTSCPNQCYRSSRRAYRECYRGHHRFSGCSVQRCRLRRHHDYKFGWACAPEGVTIPPTPSSSPSMEGVTVTPTPSSSPTVSFTPTSSPSPSRSPCPMNKPQLNPTTNECEASCDAATPFFNQATQRCEACPSQVPVFNSMLQICEGTCPGGTQAGNNVPFYGSFELGSSNGTFRFFREHYRVRDRMEVIYEGTVIHDTGCTGGSETVMLSYSGSATNVVVRVTPNCAGTTGTAWNFRVDCPE